MVRHMVGHRHVYVYVRRERFAMATRTRKTFLQFFLILFLSICHSVEPCVRTKIVRPIAKLMVRLVQRPMVRPIVRLKVRPTVRLTTSQYTKDEKCANLRTPGADFFTGF